MDWQTPASFLALVRRVGPIALDPCSTKKNPTEAEIYFHTGPGGRDGLHQPWADTVRNCGAHGVVFMNPPYGRELPRWMEKARLEARLGCEVIALVPARTDTEWFQEAAPGADKLLAYKGRIKFLNADPLAPSPNHMWSKKAGAWVPTASAAFPSAVFYWGKRERVFESVFAPYGRFLAAR